MRLRNKPRRGPPTPDQICIACNQPFRFGPRDDPDANIWTVEGKREIKISQTCERCFDSMFDEENEEE